MPWDEAVKSTFMSNTGGRPLPEQDGASVSVGDGVLQYEWRGAWVVVAHGEYDMDSIAPLTDALETAVRKHATVVLDASGVAFADSTLLNLLIRTHQAGTLRVAAPSPQLRRLCEITGADTLLELRGSVDEAAVA
ncbi:STAS domain-containing protein [Streptomyces sp. NPDC007808]|uniref:STAS domain-containing protein n=1 Tax=Streptomyces sp. NPDC007808 TaxID=3364779 RepID=UPI0036CD2594